VALVVYVLVMGSALLAVGPTELARVPTPLTAAVEAGRWSAVAPFVRMGSAVASLGVLLSLTAGVSRTAFSMARRRELPTFLDAVHGRHRTPYRAELIVGMIVCVVVLFADLRDAIGFSSFAVLMYYALANASALTLPKSELRWPRPLAVLGFVSCVLLAVSFQITAIVGDVDLLFVGSLVYF